MDDMYNRTRLLLGDENVRKLQQKKVVICGIGGVGSYCLEALARVGVGNLVLVDKDIVDVTNINRQIIALNSTIGMDKVEAAKKRVLDINPNCNINTIKQNITKENISDILKDNDFDYVVDCVDNIEAKLSIILYCYKNNIKSISSMGMANKTDPSKISISDIYKTNTCPLARIIRKKLKEMGVKKQKVVFSTQDPKKNEQNILGSVSYVPPVAGLFIASEVVNDIIKK